jgi:hypothetical protein
MMTMNTRRLCKGFRVFGLLCAAFGSTHCANEPAIKCAVTSGGGGTARFKITSATKTGTCGFDFPFTVKGMDVGEKLSVENYPPVNTDANRDQEVATIGVRSQYVGNRLFATGNIEMYTPASIALGKFTSVYPDGNDLCHVDTFSVASADIPETSVDGDGNPIDPPLPATHIEYQWSNWRTIVTAASIGGQSFAHLKYTQDGCTAEYDVAILTPEVDCSSDDDCDPKGDPASGNFGSGIPPEANATCNTDVGLCFSSKDAP